MNLDALRGSPLGHLTPISGVDPKTGETWKYWSYVPVPLPSEPRLGFAAIDAAANAGMAVARLDQAASQLPRPEIVKRPIIRREAVSTSALEGTYVDFNEALEADFIAETRHSVEQREVANYIRATEEGVRLLRERPISRRVVGALQGIIVKGTDSESYDAGDLRRRLVVIGRKHDPIHKARFVPPPEVLLEELFSDWEKWVNTENHIPIVVKMALAHYQFETIHPYADGNGRVGRLIALLQLIQGGVLKEPILNLSPWLEENKDEYRDGLLNVTLSGSFDDWVLFFSEAVQVQAQAGITVIRSLRELREEMFAALKVSGNRSSVPREIAEFLIGYPIIDVRTAGILVSVSFETANKAMRTLVELGYLEEITGRRRDRLFVCSRVMEILTA